MFTFGIFDCKLYTWQRRPHGIYYICGSARFQKHVKYDSSRIKERVKDNAKPRSTKRVYQSLLHSWISFAARMHVTIVMPRGRFFSAIPNGSRAGLPKSERTKSSRSLSTSSVSLANQFHLGAIRWKGLCPRYRALLAHMRMSSVLCDRSQQSNSAIKSSIVVERLNLNHPRCYGESIISLPLACDSEWQRDCS